VLGIVAVKVDVCPWSTIGFEIITGAAGAVKAVSTVTWSAGDGAVLEAVSVTT
jgi:hypothetical protein